MDEFQNFATDSFATILSEARKYALNLTVANQYISINDRKRPRCRVRKRWYHDFIPCISRRRANSSKQFEPQFEAGDLLQMHNRHFVMNMVINGQKSPAFSATTLSLPPEQIDNTGRIIENTRRIFSRTRAEVEAEISATMQPPVPQQQAAPITPAQANFGLLTPVQKR